MATFHWVLIVVGAWSVVSILLAVLIAGAVRRNTDSAADRLRAAHALHSHGCGCRFLLSEESLGDLHARLTDRADASPRHARTPPTRLGPLRPAGGRGHAPDRPRSRPARRRALRRPG